MIDKDTTTHMVGVLAHSLAVHEETRLRRTLIVCACVTVSVVALAVAAVAAVGGCS